MDPPQGAPGRAPDGMDEAALRQTIGIFTNALESFGEGSARGLHKGVTAASNNPPIMFPVTPKIAASISRPVPLVFYFLSFPSSFPPSLIMCIWDACVP